LFYQVIDAKVLLFSKISKEILIWLQKEGV